MALLIARHLMAVPASLRLSFGLDRAFPVDSDAQGQTSEPYPVQLLAFLFGSLSPVSGRPLLSNLS